MIVIAQDDHLTAGAWAACGFLRQVLILLGQLLRISKTHDDFYLCLFHSARSNYLTTETKS